MPASSDTTDYSYVTPASPDTSDLTGATSSNSAGSLFSATTTGLQTLDIVLTNILSDNKKLAVEPYNVQFTLSDGTTGYSALHYATRLETLGIGNLGNVNITSIADNQLLSYDNSTSKFINAKLAFDNIDAAVAVTESEGIGSNDNDTTFPTSAAVKDYVDTNVTAQDLDFSGDSGGAQSIDLDSQSLTLTGGTGIDTTGSSQTMTFAIDSTVATLAGSQTLTNKTLTSPVLNTGVSGTAILDSDTMSGASSTTLATSESIKAYVDSREDAHDQLSELTDVTITGTPADNELLAYDTSASKWINQTAAEAGVIDTGGTGLAKSSSTLNLDTNSLTEAAIADGDYIVFNDATDSNAPKKEALADVATLFAGTGLSASSSVLSVDASQTQITGVGTITTGTWQGTAIANNKLANSTVSYGGISLALGASDATPAFDLTDATNYPTSNLSGTITNAQLAGSIANAKLANSSITVSDGSSSTATALGGTITFSGTTNEVEVGEASGTITVGLPNNVTIAGNLTVNGDTTTVNTATLSVEDPLIKLANGNNAADSVDIGFYGLYDTSGSQDLYAGLFRDANDSGKFKLFKDLQAEPNTTVNTGGTGYATGTLVANLEGNVTGNVSGTSGSTTGNAATATALATARTIGGTSFDGTANIAVGLADTATALATARTIGGTSFDGTANIAVALSATATALATAREINGTSFDGTANITVTAAAGTLTGSTLNSGVTASSLTSVGTIATGVWNGTAIADSYISSASTWNAKQAALTFGIADTNAVKIDDADAADNDYAKLTASGIEGRSYAQVKTDLSLGNVENTALSTWAGTTNITTLGAATATSLTVGDNTDATTILGRAKIASPSSDIAYFSHYDFMDADSYALAQTSAGLTAINAHTGQTINLNINDTNVAQVLSTGVSVTGKVTTTGDIELGHADDTTISRVSAGVAAIQGNNILTTATGASNEDMTALAIALG